MKSKPIEQFFLPSLVGALPSAPPPAPLRRLSIPTGPGQPRSGAKRVSRPQTSKHETEDEQLELAVTDERTSTGEASSPIAAAPPQHPSRGEQEEPVAAPQVQAMVEKHDERREILAIPQEQVTGPADPVPATTPGICACDLTASTKYIGKCGTQNHVTERKVVSGNGPTSLVPSLQDDGDQEAFPETATVKNISILIREADASANLPTQCVVDAESRPVALGSSHEDRLSSLRKQSIAGIRSRDEAAAVTPNTESLSLGGQHTSSTSCIAAIPQNGNARLTRYRDANHRIEFYVSGEISAALNVCAMRDGISVPMFVKKTITALAISGARAGAT